jgi:hypothetical protein
MSIKTFSIDPFPEDIMKTTFYFGENDEHKVDVILQKFGKELVYVDDILSVLGSPVHDLRYYK